MKAKTFSQLFSGIRNDMANNLFFSSNLQDKIAEVMHEKVKTEVYDKYEPKVYQRRGNNDGLLDMDNMEFTDVDVHGNSVVLTFQNTAQTNNDNEEDLSPIIEEGTGGDRPYEKPRPFTELTRLELDSNSKNELYEAFKKDLNKLGYKTK